MPTTIESLEIEVQSSATSATGGIDALSASLSKLRNAVKGGVGLNSVVNQISKLDTALKGVDGSSADKINKLANSLQKLQGLGAIKISSSIGNQLKNIGTAAATLNGTDLSGIGKLGSALQPLNNIGNMSGLKSVLSSLAKLPQVAQTLNSMDWSAFASQIQQLSNALAPLANRLATVSQAFGRLPANLRSVVSATNQTANANGKTSISYTNLWAKARMAYNVVRVGARLIAGWITQSNAYIENLNLFNASMGEYAEEAQKYAEQVGEIMGIDPGEWMRNQGVFNTIIKGFGVASDRAYTMSKNLTQLGYDISSFYNISFEDAMTKLQSGISGELEPLRRLGYDLSVARLQQEAYTLGIQKKVSAMTQAEKSELRYHAIMTQVTTAQGDMARTLNAPANQLRILKAQVAQCARALGNIFIPVLNAVLPYAIALAKVIKMVADAIASFFGFELPEVDYSGMSAGSTAVGDLAENADDAAGGLGKADKAAKKLKNNLLGIDELNIISPDDGTLGSGGSGGSGGTGGLGGGGLGFELPEYDFLGEAVRTKVDEIVNFIRDAMWDITAVISTFLLAIGTILVVTGAKVPLGLGLMAAGAVGLATAIIANWNGMSEQLAKILAAVTEVLGGFLLAIGAFLVFSGANVPLGAALMVLGAVSLATALAINWKFLDGDLKSALASIEMIVSGAMLGLGAVLAFTGTKPALGVALMAAGAVGLVTAIGLKWDSLSAPVKKTIASLEMVIGTAFLTLGAILAFTGKNIPLGIGLIAAGAVSVASAAALNWNAMTDNIRETVKTITKILSTAFLVLGAFLAFTGKNIPLGIGLIAAGAVGLGGSLGLDWESMPKNINSVVTKILTIVGVASLAIGAVLTFTGGATALGIGLIASGAASLAAAVALNWDYLTNKIRTVTTKILTIVGAAALVIGVILLFTGAGTALGVGLILAGAASLGTAVAINWDTIKNKVKEGLDAIASKFGEFKDTVSKKLDEAKTKISKWAGGVKEWFTKGADGKNAIDNIKEAASEWGESFKTGLSEKFSNAKSWVNEHITSPLEKAVKDSKAVEFAVEVKDKASEWWGNVKTWWGEKAKNGVNLDAFVSLVKDKWSTVKQWIGNIPTLEQFVALAKEKWDSVKQWIGDIPGLSQAISLLKSGWNTVEGWIGDIPGLSQAISLLKSGWTTVKNWVGNIPVLSQAVSLLKSGWTTVKNWIGNVPVLSQAVSLLKSGWTTVKNWIGNIPGLSQAISLLKSGWDKVSGWVQDFMGGTVEQKIGLLKNGWSTVAGWVKDHIGGAIDVTVNLVSKWKNKIKEFFGLSGGGIVTAGGGIEMFSSGGIVGKWKGVSQYAGGTNNVHGSLFVAGENGAEIVGHVNGQTEVINRFQMAEIMRNSVIAGMSQFINYWKNIYGRLAVCANAVIQSVTTGAYSLRMAMDAMGAGNASNTETLRVAAGMAAESSVSGMRQSMLENMQTAYANAQSEAQKNRTAMADTLRDFYIENVDRTLREIAADAKRQADKEERVIVQIGGKVVSDAVAAQKRADGYSFTK